MYTNTFYCTEEVLFEVIDAQGLRGKPWYLDLIDSERKENNVSS